MKKNKNIEKQFIRCSKCNSNLRVPKGLGIIEVTCPVCKLVFKFNSGPKEKKLGALRLFLLMMKMAFSGKEIKPDTNQPFNSTAVNKTTASAPVKNKKPLFLFGKKKIIYNPEFQKMFERGKALADVIDVRYRPFHFSDMSIYLLNTKKNYNSQTHYAIYLTMLYSDDPIAENRYSNFEKLLTAKMSKTRFVSDNEYDEVVNKLCEYILPGKLSQIKKLTYQDSYDIACDHFNRYPGREYRNDFILELPLIVGVFSDFFSYEKNNLKKIAKRKKLLVDELNKYIRG